MDVAAAVALWPLSTRAAADAYSRIATLVANLASDLDASDRDAAGRLLFGIHLT